MLHIYNTSTSKKEPFKPIDPSCVKIYVCGLTTYDYCHIGNARSAFVVFDVVVRYLKEKGYKVKYVRNITDIDDKIILRARENKEDYKDLTKRFIDYMHEDEKALGSLSPDIEPLATDHILEITDLIKILIERGYAYVAKSGDVYYDVSKFDDYGALAHQDIKDLKAGARVEISSKKTNPLDFVLWKRAKENEPSWDSPWGRGRPGWHIECSAMSSCYLGKHFDIHGGGADLQFPHHQNEIAQSQAAFDSKFVNTWMHVGYVKKDDKKMSKSLGNFFTLREALKIYNPEVIRYFMISSHYRSQLNYSKENLENAKQALERIYIALRNIPLDNTRSSGTDTDNKFIKKFYEAMDDDFNTPKALAILFELVHEINKMHENKKFVKNSNLFFTLKRLGNILGILQQSPEKFLYSNIENQLKERIESLVKMRNHARSNKDWKKSDQIRDELKSMNVELEDTSKCTLWRII